MVSAEDFTSVDAILALLSIAIGITIFLMQRRADEKINRIVQTQFRRQELEKKYFGTRLINNLELVKKNHMRLAQFTSDYVAKRSKMSMSKVKNFCTFQITNLDGYVIPAMRDDLGHLIQFVDDPELVDQLSIAFDDFSSLFKDCSVDSLFEEPDDMIKAKSEEAKKRSEVIEAFLKRFELEIPKIV